MKLLHSLGLAVIATLATTGKHLRDDADLWGGSERRRGGAAERSAGAWPGQGPVRRRGAHLHRELQLERLAGTTTVAHIHGPTPDARQRGRGRHHHGAVLRRLSPGHHERHFRHHARRHLRGQLQPDLPDGAGRQHRRRRDGAGLIPRGRDELPQHPFDGVWRARSAASSPARSRCRPPSGRSWPG